MTRKILRGVSCENTKKLAGAIKDYIEAHNKTAEPFRWRKRGARGAQLADKITNLCNQSQARCPGSAWRLARRVKSAIGRP